jgi:hypothetical protein
MMPIRKRALCNNLFVALILLTTALLNGRKNSCDETCSTTVLIYMAADNDLLPFADRNLEQLKQIGSNEHLKILVHLDTHRRGFKKSTQRIIIHKNRIELVGKDIGMDSGDEKTLIDACAWALDYHDSDHFVLIAWNHGTGPLNPFIRHFNPKQLFKYNPSTRLIEVDRTIEFMEFINQLTSSQQCRGICFDESTGNYLTEQKFRKALATICQEYRDGEKIDLIAFDACLMGGAEVAFNVMPYARYMVASQEVELGTGYDYIKILGPLLTGKMTPQQLAIHIVQSFKETYSKITFDYTHAALDLENFEAVHQSIDTLASLLIEAIKRQKNNSVRRAIQKSCDKNLCTSFDEPGYKDLRHFLTNLLTNLDQCELQTHEESILFKQNLKTILEQCLLQLKAVVFANVAGRNLKEASGVSIYIPDRKIHPSYHTLDFTKKNRWGLFLIQYLGA